MCVRGIVFSEVPVTYWEVRGHIMCVRGIVFSEVPVTYM
jgi:hypothetical protein